MLLQCLNGLISQCVLTQCADSKCLQPELSCMICKVGRRTTKFLSVGKYIPQDFSESYYITFHIIHNLNYLLIFGIYVKR